MKDGQTIAEIMLVLFSYVKRREWQFLHLKTITWFGRVCDLVSDFIFFSGFFANFFLFSVNILVGFLVVFLSCVGFGHCFCVYVGLLLFCFFNHMHLTFRLT